MPLPQRPQQHITGELGQDEAALVFKRWGWTAAQVAPDYGEDLACNIFIDGLRTNLYFRCQVKSKNDGSTYVRELVSGDFAVSIDTTTLRAWLSSLFPVLLIVYDESSHELYWTEATHQILEVIDKLDQGSATLRISRGGNLRNQRVEVQASVQKFYQNLLRLSKPAVEFVVYPILMPKYRTVSSQDMFRFGRGEPLKSASGENERVEQMNFSVDSLPSWTAALETLSYDRTIPGAIIRAPLPDLDSLAVLVRQTVLELAEAARLAAGEWVSVACGPSKLVAMTGQTSDEIAWNREITPWRSYSVIESRIVVDLDYAFTVPDGFCKGHRVRSMSWDGVYYLNRELDVALQVSARVSSTPADRMVNAMRRQQFANNFAPWICPVGEAEAVHERVSAIGLAYDLIEEFRADEGEVAGIIREPFFNPALGLSAMSIGWDEYDRDSVYDRLSRADLVDKLPGRLGSKDLEEFVLRMCSGGYQEVPERFQITIEQYTLGMPIDHGGRLVTLQRFGECSDPQAEAGRKVLEQFRVRLSSSGLVEECSAADLVQIETIGERSIFQVSVSWRPLLEESLGESVSKVLAEVLGTFRQVLPNVPDAQCGDGDRRFGSSYDVLHFLGQIVFEDIEVE